MWICRIVLFVCIFYLHIFRIAMPLNTPEYKVKEGEAFELSCTLPPNLANNSTVFWSRGSEVISEGENITMTEDSQRFSLDRPYNSDWLLKINGTKRTDEGIYKCYIETETIVTVPVVVEYAPAVEGYDSDEIYLQVCKGLPRLNLWCNITGKPLPTIRWFFRQSKTAPEIYISLSTEMIPVPNVDQSKTGIYSCQVTNKHGADTMVFHISVIDQVTRLKDTTPAKPLVDGPNVLGNTSSAGHGIPALLHNVNVVWCTCICIVLGML